jgi:DNA-binding transcriptional ArsR family regulator
MTVSAKAFTALGDPTRRIIFEKLRNRPLAVVDIAAGMHVSRPAVSQHLKVLHEAKLIRMHRQGTKTVCEIAPQGIVAIREYLERFWNTALDAFSAAAEKEQQNQKRKK